MKSDMNVGLFNVKYSPNLGDGLLCECLETALQKIGNPDLNAYSIDLAGRSSYTAGKHWRENALKILDVMPLYIRRAAVRLPSVYRLRTRFIPHYFRMTDGADAIVVGGGNIFADADLNFPLKLNGALNVASKRRLPVAIYGVGVSESWSSRGIDLVRNSLKKCDVRYVSVRDNKSKINFDRYFGEATGHTAKVVYDPAFLASAFWQKHNSCKAKQIVGVNITSAIAIRYHSKFRPNEADLADWYIDICREFSRSGKLVSAFTNGSPEDNSFLDRIRSRLATIPDTEICKASTPTELLSLISRFSLVIAHRMHTIIPCYAYSIPFLPLKWDDKIDSLVELLDLPFAPMEAITTEPYKILALGNELISRDQASPSRTDIIQESFACLREMVASLQI